MLQSRVCKQCGKTFAGGPRAYYCLSCRENRRRDQNKKNKASQRAGTVRKLKSCDTCANCGNPYEISAGPQRYCPVCGPIMYKEHHNLSRRVCSKVDDPDK